MFYKIFLRASRRCLLATITIALLGACSDSTERAEGPVVLRVSVLPDQDKEALERRYRPLIDYLQRQTGYTLELNIPESYDAVSMSFREGTTDLAWLEVSGGLVSLMLRATRP